MCDIRAGERRRHQPVRPFRGKQRVHVDDGVAILQRKAAMSQPPEARGWAGRVRDLVEQFPPAIHRLDHSGYCISTKASRMPLGHSFSFLGNVETPETGYSLMSFPILSKLRYSWGRTPVLRPTSTSASSCADMAGSVARRAGPGGPAQTWRSAHNCRSYSRYLEKRVALG